MEKNPSISVLSSMINKAWHIQSCSKLSPIILLDKNNKNNYYFSILPVDVVCVCHTPYLLI